MHEDKTTYMRTDSQAGRQTDTQEDRQTCMKLDCYAGRRKTCRKTASQTGRQAGSPPTPLADGVSPTPLILGLDDRQTASLTAFKSALQGGWAVDK